MSAPKNPVGGSARQANTLAAVIISSSELTPAESRRLMAYRKMDERRRRENLPFMEDTVRIYPMRAKSAAHSGPRGIHLAAAFGKVVRP